MFISVYLFKKLHIYSKYTYFFQQSTLYTTIHSQGHANLDNESC